MQILEALAERGEKWLDPDAPLSPNSAGGHCSKVGMIALFRAIAAVLGLGLADVTGHAGRVSGARRLAGIGLELALIQLMARWSSSVILEYVRDAPLLSITSTTKANVMGWPRGRRRWSKVGRSMS